MNSMNDCHSSKNGLVEGWGKQRLRPDNILQAKGFLFCFPMKTLLLPRDSREGNISSKRDNGHGTAKS